MQKSAGILNRINLEAYSNESPREHNNAITLSRITGMFLIVLCHTIKFYWFVPWHESLGQFLNCGVHLFLFISGYLYGDRAIKNYKEFYQKRFYSVSLPAILISVFTIIALLLVGVSISIQSIVFYSLDLEGLLFLNWSFFSSLFSEIDSLGHLWFTTIIVICYLLIPALQKLICYLRTNKYNSVFFCLFTIVGMLIYVLLSNIITLVYILWFVIGYLSGNIELLNKVKFKSFFVYTLLFVMSVVGRIIIHIFFDDTIFYTTFVGISLFIAGTWFVVFYSYLNNRFNETIKKISRYKIVKVFDNYSYYIYLTHGIFCSGVFNIFDKMSLFFATIVFIVVTVVFAVVLKTICSSLRKKWGN